jgi:hypothetical protein
MEPGFQSNVTGVGIEGTAGVLRGLKLNCVLERQSE